MFLVPFKFGGFRRIRNIDITLQDENDLEARGTHKHAKHGSVDIYVHLRNYRGDISNIDDMDEVAYFITGVFLDEFICAAILDEHSCENCVPFVITEAILQLLKGGE